ncbi:hypothetical protein PM082_010365 [Marasmius tenuissimus]|nr:hypothetical protein PM082_010365 [Marasmius tenuissimus]
MPRIRKKTSKRSKTHERARLHKKIKESKRKKARDAKKSVQWKSKHKKDPGIPNNFPYKDQVLAEVQEQRRLATEEKQRKKEEQKALRVGTGKRIDGDHEEDEDDTESDSEDQEGESADEENEDVDLDDKDGDTQGVGSVSAKRIASNRIATRPVAMEVDDNDDVDEEDAPLLINCDLPNLKAVLEKADVVIQVLDARDPLSFRSTQLEELVASSLKKRILFVFTKIDNAPREAVKSWSSALRKQHPTLLFRAATAFLPESPRIPEDVKGKQKAPKKPVEDAVGVDAISKCLGDWAKEMKKGEGEVFNVAVVGVANAGKSSLINSIAKRATFPIYTPSARTTGPTTTFLPQEVTTEVDGLSMCFIDTPGFSWDWEKDENAAKTRCHDILIRNRGRIDRLKDPAPPLAEIVSRASAEDLMLLYSLPAFPKGDVDAFLSGVARAQQLVKKKGTLDLAAATRMVLRDWNVGKLRYYCTPPSSNEQDGKVKGSESWYAEDEVILSTLQPRKEMRREGGLVKLASGTPDSRNLTLEREYDDGDDSSDESEEGEDEDFGVMDVDVDDEEEVVDDEEEEEEEDEDARKRKRKPLRRRHQPSKSGSGQSRSNCLQRRKSRSPPTPKRHLQRKHPHRRRKWPTSLQNLSQREVTQVVEVKHTTLASFSNVSYDPAACYSNRSTFASATFRIEVLPR